MKRFIWILIIFPYTLTSQNPGVIDSLLKVLKLNQFENDTLKYKAYSGLTAGYYPVDKDSAKYYNRMAYEFSKEAKILEGEINALNNFGVFAFEDGNNQEAEQIYFQVLDLARSNNLENPQKFATWNLGNISYSEGEYSEAIDRFIEAVHLSEKANDERSLAQLYINISICADELNLFKEQKYYAKKAIELAKKLNNHFIEGYGYSIWANTYIDTDLDSAQYYYSMADSIRKLSDYDLPKLQWEIETGFGHVSGRKGALEASLKHFKTAQAINKTYELHTIAYRSNCDLARIFLELGVLDSALVYFERFLASVDSNVQTYYKIGCYENLIHYYETIGAHDQANQIYHLIRIMQDSLYNSEMKVAVLDLERKYQASQKEAKILEQQLQIDQRTRQRNMIIILLIALGLTSFLLFIIMQQQNKRKAIIAANEKERQQQRIEQLEREKQIATLSSMIEGQEIERVRIAKDLHDGLGVLLSSVRRQVQNVQSEIQKLTEMDLIGNTESMIQTACDEVRRISHDMMPDALMNLGLKDAVLDLIYQTQEETQIHVAAEIDDELMLTHIQSVNIYRIIQEIINNMVKHARANNFSIQLNRVNDMITLIAQDNGIGFSYQEKLQDEGIGLNNIESRVKFLNGKMKVLNVQGTRYEIQIPLER